MGGRLRRGRKGRGRGGRMWGFRFCCWMGRRFLIGGWIWIVCMGLGEYFGEKGG